MKIRPLIPTIFLLSFLQISLAFTCSDLSENQCKQLQPDGCIWSGTTCTGSYSPSCAPLSCYYIDPNSQSTATPDGTPEKPFKTLSDGFTKISGKDGFLIIVNILKNATAAVNKAATLTSNITVKPLFGDSSCMIDFAQVPSSTSAILTVKNSLKLIGTNLGLQFVTVMFGGVTVMSISSGGAIYFENLEVNNTPSGFALLLVKTTNGTFSMVNCRFANSSVSFQSSNNDTIIWKNVYGSGTTSLRNSLSLLRTMVMEDCIFTDSLGAAFLTVNSGYPEVLLKNCTFQNLALSPLFTINSDVKLTIENCIFDQIVSNSLKMFVFQQSRSSYAVPSVIKNISFTNIAVRTTLLYLEGQTVSLSLQNVTMENITQQAGYAKDISSLAVQMSLPRGICLTSVLNAQLSIESSNFSNIPSHCLGLRDTTFTIKSSVFDNSQLWDAEEDLIVREDISSLDEDSGVSWVNIEGTSNFYSDILQISVQDNKFIHNGIMAKYGGAIRFTGSVLTQITIIGNEFIGNKAYYGGAISTQNAVISLLQLDNNIFVDNSAYHGGAIYKNGNSSSESLSGPSISITNSHFIGNKATKNGGALHLNWDCLWVSDTEFISNSAVNGGALYYINQDETENKKYAGMKSVSFIQNSASNVGGAMKLLFEYSRLKAEAIILENNVDRNQKAVNQGGPSYYLLSFYDIINSVKAVKDSNLQDLIRNPKLTSLSFTVNTSESSANLAEIGFKSGNELAKILHVQVFDDQNNVADYIDNEQITIEMVAYQNNISNYPASLVPNPVMFTVSNGHFFAKNTIKMHGEPKTTATLQFSNLEEGFSDFLQDSKIVKSFDLQVRFVDCEVGDIFDSSTRAYFFLYPPQLTISSCVTCAAGSYSFENPYIAKYCNDCPEEINCYGGNQVGPQSGYWMGDLNSLDAIKCPDPSVCLGGYVDYEYFPHGKCLYPHQGNLCNQCAPKFAKFGSSTKCEACENNAGYYFKFVLFLVLQVAVILGLYKLNKKKQDENHTFYVNTVLILINFIQINSIVINYDLGWSSEAKNSLHVINSFIPSNHDGFSIDCILSLALPDNQHLNFVKLIVTFFQPFIIWGLSILAYLFILLGSSSDRKHITRKIKAALGYLFIISAFLVQPNIILTCLELFSCQNLGSSENPKYFLTTNSEVRCWAGSHLIWSLAVAFPLLLVWAILLPGILFFKTRKCLAKTTSWQPFFYQGLEKNRFYWEFLMLSVRTLVIFFFTVLNIIQTKFQVLGTFFICISLTAFFLKLHPYADPRTHLLGLLSFSSLSLLSYIGFFTFIDNWKGAQRIFSSVFLIIANCAVFLLPVFYIIKDYSRTKKTSQPPQKAHPQMEEESPKLENLQITKAVSEKIEVKSQEDSPRNEDSAICPADIDQEMKIGNIVFHAKREKSIDNFSVLQSSASGSGPATPLQTTPTSSPRVFSPLSTSRMLVKPSIFSKESFLQKKIGTKKISLKQFVADEMELGSVDSEKDVCEVTKTEMGGMTLTGRTQGDVEFENLLKALKFNKIPTKSNE